MIDKNRKKIARKVEPITEDLSISKNYYKLLVHIDKNLDKVRLEGQDSNKIHKQIIELMDA